MSGEIRANALGVALDKATLTEGLEDYCSCKLFSLTSVAPVAGSRVHDGELSASLQSSLESYGQVVHAIGQMFEDAHAAIVGADARSASALGTR